MNWVARLAIIQLIAFLVAMLLRIVVWGLRYSGYAKRYLVPGAWVFRDWNYLCKMTGRYEIGFRIFGFEFSNKGCPCGR